MCILLFSTLLTPTPGNNTGWRPKDKPFRPANVNTSYPFTKLHGTPDNTPQLNSKGQPIAKSFFASKDSYNDDESEMLGDIGYPVTLFYVLTDAGDTFRVKQLDAFYKERRAAYCEIQEYWNANRGVDRQGLHDQNPLTHWKDSWMFRFLCMVLRNQRHALGKQNGGPANNPTPLTRDQLTPFLQDILQRMEDGATIEVALGTGRSTAGTRHHFRVRRYRRRQPHRPIFSRRNRSSSTYYSSSPSFRGPVSSSLNPSTSTIPPCPRRSHSTSVCRSQLRSPFVRTVP